MSNTKFKNASRVWDAFQQCISNSGGGEDFSVRTAEIVKMAGMSKTTVLRYMKMAQAEGVVSARVVYGTLFWSKVN